MQYLPHFFTFSGSFFNILRLSHALLLMVQYLLHLKLNSPTQGQKIDRLKPILVLADKRESFLKHANELVQKLIDIIGFLFLHLEFVIYQL